MLQRIFGFSGRSALGLAVVAGLAAVAGAQEVPSEAAAPSGASHAPPTVDYWSMLFVLLLATVVGIGVIRRVSRLLHTPLMSLTNAISAIAVVGAIIVTGTDYPEIDYGLTIRVLGAVALVASMTNIVSGFLLTDRMLKMFKQPGPGRRDDAGRKS
jgi:NAD(P) transhydrogenase subunit alpha